MSTARDKFLDLLRHDILKLDLAELDFGIYRILNYRRREIDAFLEGELPQWIDDALKTLPGAPTEDEQGRLFHHLYTFLSRYYDDGDFVTRPRRGRDAAYSVPYNGQDVHFWWASKGSHYVKSGERFGAYVWHDGPRRIRIDVAQADVEKDNVKGVKRYYLPISIDEADSELQVKLAFRPLNKDEAKRFEKKRKADDDETDDSEAIEGRSAQERILNAWFDGDGPCRARIPAGVDKALLRKHLNRYVAGQSSDFFVHPQLGRFLEGELDYYLKNEFLELWDRVDGEALARERGKFAIVRKLGRIIIACLAAIEDVQAQLFEKRKFVLASDWLARVSALPEGKAAQALIDEACANAGQVNEWLAWLGEKPLAKNAVPEKRAADLLATCPHLCIHTRHFDAGFKHRLLGLFDDIEAATGGTLIHAENYAALRTLEYAYRQRVKCIYIDPPYNTGKDDFLYLDSSPHASWAALIEGRMRAAIGVLADDGAHFMSIDDNEADIAALISDMCFGAENRVARIIWEGANKNTARQIGVSHEYVLTYARNRAVLPKEWSIRKVGVELVLAEVERLRSIHGDDYDSISEALSGWFVAMKAKPVFALRRFRQVDSRGAYKEDDPTAPGGRKFKLRNSRNGTEIPLRRGRGWAFDQEAFDRMLEDGRIRFVTPTSVMVKRYLHETSEVTPPSVFYQPARSASERLADILGEAVFDFPKDETVLQKFVEMACPSGADAVLDYFAGSGTTGHAVINLNREDGGCRRFVLVEQGEYFDSVLLPRIAKVIACPEWKDGKPKAGVAMHGGDEHWAARSPALVQVLRLERYEDSLDALELPSEAAARRAGQMSFAGDALLRYVHEACAGKASITLNHHQLAKPFALQIPQTQRGAPMLVDVDLASTALLLLGLHPVRLREVVGTQQIANRYLLIEARPNGKPNELHLLFLRDFDDSMNAEGARNFAVAERDWLGDTLQREFGRAAGDYACVWYNRDAVLPSVNGRSLDPEVIRRMLERAPQERTQ